MESNNYNQDNNYNYDNNYNQDYYQEQYSSEYNNQDNNKKEKKARSFSLGKVIAYALIFGIVAGGAFAGVNYGIGLIKNDNNIPIQNAEIPSNQLGSVDGTVIATDVSATVAAVMPGVVSITAVTIKEYSDMFGRTGTQIGQGQGSGFIVAQTDSEILVMTNYHVVEEKSSFTVGFCDGEGAEATVMATDASTDLAIVAVKLTSLKDSTKNAIRVLTLADSSKVVAGQAAIAIGNALGYGQSVTFGVISKTEATINNGTATYTVLQTDAAINAGNSGGPLFNAQGEVIGINDAKSIREYVEGVCWAIPTNSAKALLEKANNGGGDVTEIKGDNNIYNYISGIFGNGSNNGKNDDNSSSNSKEEKESNDSTEGKRLLGVSVITIGSEESEKYHVPKGVYISAVTSGSIAEAAGLKAGDVITSFDETKVSSNQELIDLIQALEDGRSVRIEYQKYVGADSSGNPQYTSTSTTAQF